MNIHHRKEKLLPYPSLLLKKGEIVMLKADEAESAPYIITDVLGSGTYGDVFECHHTISGSRVALKVYKSFHTSWNPERPDMVLLDQTTGREFNALIFDHPCIVKCYEMVKNLEKIQWNKKCEDFHKTNNKELMKRAVQDKPKSQVTIGLVMELCEKPMYMYYNSLLQSEIEMNLDKSFRCFSSKYLLAVKKGIFEIACGIAYMHQLGFFHRDIKPSNILLGNDGVLKIADFGLMRRHRCGEADSNTTHSDKILTLWYRAPEVILRLPYDKKVDVWSLGCMLIECFTFELRYGKPQCRALFCNVTSDIELLMEQMRIFGTPKATSILRDASYWSESFPYFQTPSFRTALLKQNIPDECQDLILKMVEMDPHDRCDIWDVLEHSYFHEVKDSCADLLPQKKLYDVATWEGVAEWVFPHSDVRIPLGERFSDIWRHMRGKRQEEQPAQDPSVMPSNVIANELLSPEIIKNMIHNTHNQENEKPRSSSKRDNSQDVLDEKLFVKRQKL